MHVDLPVKLFLVPVLLLALFTRDGAAQPVPRSAESRRHAPVVRSFAPTAKARVIAPPVTTIKGKELEISTTVELGRPKLAIANASVVGASPTTKFSTVTWPRVTSVGLPGGAVMIDAQKADRESIPGLSLTFAVPSSATGFQLSISDADWLPVDAHFLPAPATLGDTSVLRVTASYPDVPGISWSKPRTFRSLRSVSVWIPLARTTGSRALLTKARLTLRCRFSGELTSQSVSDPIFAGLNHALVLNAGDLARFAVPLRPTTISVAKAGAKIQSVSGDYAAIDTSAYKWIDPSAIYIKLTLTRDGIYRITPSEIAARAAGFDMTAAGWRADNLRAFHLGKEVPISVDVNLVGEITAVTLYGERRRGPYKEYYDNSTDSSAYFLTVAGSGPVRRYRTLGHSPIEAVDVASGEVLQHHERDLFYYLGDKVFNEIETTNRTEVVSGERFYWYAFHGPSSNDSSRLVDTFYVSGLPAQTAGKVARFHFFFRGMSVDPQFPNDPTHHVRIRLNGEEIAESFFNEYDSLGLEPVVPLSKLRAGANRIEVISAGTRATIDQFYLDYYEVRYEASIAPSQDTSVTRGQYDWMTNGSPVVMRFLTLPSDAVVLNLSDSVLLTAPFIDSANTSKHYVASRPSEMLKPDAVAKVTNWAVLDSRNAADYIVLTHPDFRHAADLLKVRRSGTGLRSSVVDIEDVFNAFGYGVNDPESIRRFLSYAYYKYAGTPVSMVTLVGDGSLDPKLNQNNELTPEGERSNQRSFIPTYGNPVSDFYYTLSDAGTLDTLQPHMLIARIPVSKAEEADAYVAKLVEYESQAPAEWNHNFLFVPGGNAGFQHRSFVDEAHFYLAPDGVGLVLPPTNVHGTLIERTDFSGPVDNTHVPDIQSAVRQGQAIFYFTGHGATFITDVQLGDPGLWRNKELYPVLITLSCRTGAFAEPNQVSLNEAFLRASEGGVIMALGTTGYGEVTYDNMMSTRLFQLMRSYPQWHDTAKATMMNLTQIFTAAKLFAADSGGLGTVGLNSRLQYSVLGDAALGFVLRPQPEFVERPSDIQVVDRNNRPSTTVHITDTTMRVEAIVHNVGFSADRPVVVRIRDAAPKGTPFDVFDTLSRLDTTATVSATFFFGKDGAGEHTISVKIDPLDAFAETHEEDNEASTRVLVSGISVSPLFPFEGSVGVCDITATAAHVVLIVPRTDAGLLQGKIEVELDTTESFSVAWRSQANISNTQYVELDLPLTNVPQPSTRVYWWRARLVPTVGEPTEWQMASFLSESSTAAGFAYRSREQLERTIVAGLQIDDRGGLYLPQHDSVIFDVISLGSKDPWTLGVPRSSITINDRPTYEFGNVGYVLAELTADGSALDTVYEFLHSDDSAEQAIAAEQFVSTVNSIPKGRRVILLTNWQPFMYYFNLSPRVQSAIESLGGTLGFRSVGYFESYALIGAKGMAPGTAKEKRSEESKGPTELLDTVVTLGTSGIAEFPSTAASTAYYDLSWEGSEIPAGADIRFSVMGRKHGSAKDEELATFSASSGRTFDLRTIDPRQYDRLILVASFERSSSGIQSPELTGVRIRYDAAPELAFEEDTLAVQPGSVVEGQPTVASYTVRTLTCTAADQIPIALLRSNKGVVDTVTHQIAHLAGHASISIRDTLRTQGEQGSVTVSARINPDLTFAEQLTFNDEISGSYYVGRDTSKPISDILVDDRHLPAYGYASNEPWITINMVSASAIPQTDSLAISARFLREDSASSFVTIATASPGDFRVEYVPAVSGGAHASLRFQPLHPLAPGKYQIAAYSHDASGNVADTIYQTFTVTSENGLERVMNYPNPFKTETDFTYVLRNSGKADVTIAIYTVAGHKIRTLKAASTHAGMNALHWDGRDEEGNVLANGTYLYRVVLTSDDDKGASSTQALTEKAVISR